MSGFRRERADRAGRRRAAEAALFSMGTPLASEKDGEPMPQKIEEEKKESLFGRWFKK